MCQSFNGSGLKVVAVDQDWKVLFINDGGEIYGSLYSDECALYKGSCDGESPDFLERFPTKIKAIFVSSHNTIFVCLTGAVYRSSDQGRSFSKVLELGSSVSFFRHNNGMTETPGGMLVIAEYGNQWEKRRWRKLAYLYFSVDDGKVWERSDFLIKEGINKHVHLVKHSRLLNRLVVADGDNKKKAWVSKSLNPTDLKSRAAWRPLNRFHIQLGGYTSVVETDGKLVLGTDYQGGTNFVVETTDCERFKTQVVPDPYRRSPIDNMVPRKSRSGNEIWANLPFSTGNSRCLLMYTKDGGATWNRFIQYSRRTHKTWLISASRDGADELYFSVERNSDGARSVFRVTDAS
jgi:hypothetical protein